MLALLIICSPAMTLPTNPVSDFVVSSNWPFDLVRKLGGELLASYARTTELDKCLAILHPAFSMLSDDVALPAGLSRNIAL